MTSSRKRRVSTPPQRALKKINAEAVDAISVLPRELQLHIFSFFNKRQLCETSPVCKNFQSLAQELYPKALYPYRNYLTLPSKSAKVDLPNRIKSIVLTQNSQIITGLPRGFTKFTKQLQPIADSFPFYSQNARFFGTLNKGECMAAASETAVALWKNLANEARQVSPLLSRVTKITALKVLKNDSIVIGDNAGNAYLMDSLGNLKCTFNHNKPACQLLQLGERVVIFYDDNTNCEIKIWEVNQRNQPVCRQTMILDPDTLSVAVLDDQTLLSFCATSLCIWDMRSIDKPTKKEVELRNLSPIQCIRVLSDGNFITRSARDEVGDVIHWSKSGVKLKELRYHNDNLDEDEEPTCIAELPNGYVAIGTSCSNIVIHDLVNNRPIQTISLDEANRVTTIKVDEKGNLVAAVANQLYKIDFAEILDRPENLRPAV